MRNFTPEELGHPLASWIRRPPDPPDTALLAGLDAPMDPALALPPEELRRLLDDAPLPVETGWCVLPDGAGCVSTCLPMPGVTPEMVRWWFVWHGLDPVRYILWFPPDHYGLEVRRGRERLLDSAIPLGERLHGVVHRVEEDVSGQCTGTPPSFDIHFRAPEELGFRLGDGEHAAIIGAFPDPEDTSSTGMPALMCHVFRPVPGGVELRSRFWMGYGMRDGRPFCAMPPGRRMPEAVPRNLARHGVLEYTNLSRILPELYAREGGKPLI